MRRIIHVLSLVTALTALPVAFAQNYNPCANPVQQNWCEASPAASDITLLSATLSPNPIQTGQPVTITLTSADSKKYRITSATYGFVVFYNPPFATTIPGRYPYFNPYYNNGPFPIIAQSGDGCPVLARLFGLGQGCPIEPYTAMTSTFTFTLPQSFPPGTYEGYFVSNDQNGDVIQNFQFDMPVSCSTGCTAPPPSAPVSGVCDGIYTGTYEGNLNVSSGQNCIFAGGGVTGNVQVSGGNLTLSGATVTGNVQLSGGGNFSILPSTAINGNLEIQNFPSSMVVNQICGATVNGNLQFHNNGAPVQIGSSSPFCPGNTVGGNLEVHNNTAQTLVIGNSVNGNLHDQNNSAATTPATVVIGNVVSNKLQCQNNSSIMGGPNPGSKNIQGDCY